MRIASLAALVAAAAFWAPQASAQCTGTEGTDFFRVPVSEVNAIPQANIDQLNAAGTDLDLSEIQTLLTSDLEGQLVELTGAVMSDPQLSGLASLNGDGIPGRIHYWLRDSDAASGDVAGQTIQIVDSNGDGFAQSLQVGLEVTLCGFVSPFVPGNGGKVMQISPLANQTAVVGSFPSDSPILDPVVITTDDIHDTYDVGGEIRSQIDWSAYSDFNGQYVRFEGIELVQGVQGDRPNVLYSSAGQGSQINQYDTSVCFRNDRGADYFPNGDVPSCITDGDFQPPPTGVVDLQGFLVYQGDDGGFNYSIPDPANFVISPIEAEDFVLTTAPPTVVVTGPTEIPGPTDDVTITIEAIPGDGTIASVVVNYEYVATGQTGSANATNTSGDLYEATIPAGPNGSFVAYSVTATDTQGGSTTSETLSYRIFSGPVTAIAEIQETFDGGPGDSPLFTGDQAAIEIDLTARVQAVIPVGSNFNVILQDDAGLAPFTGIWAFVGTNADGLAVGQEINITAAELDENFGVTELSNLMFTVTGTPGAYDYKVVPTSVLAASDAAEQHEGMMIRFEDVTITDTNADGDDTDNGFGEWQFTNGAPSDEVRADDRSENIPNDFNLQNLPVGATVDFIQGAWYFSFGNYKLVPVELSDIGAIITAGEADADALALGLSVAPNPLGATTTVRFETPAAGPVSLRVFDATGRQVATLLDRELGAGPASAELDARGLAAGVYVVRLQAGATVATQQISVVR